MVKPTRVTVMSTGGTIASSDTGRGAVASRGADEVVAGTQVDGVEVRTRDVLRIGSYLLTHADLRQIAADAFSSADSGPIGQVAGGRVRLVARPVRPSTLAMPDSRFDRTRVDVVSSYPGADATLAEAAVRAGARGVIIAGTGAGNGNHALVDWTRRVTRQGVAVGLSTRVAEGPAVPNYGNGGGADLKAAGAIIMGGLRLFHARILLALLISSGIGVSPLRPSANTHDPTTA